MCCLINLMYNSLNDQQDTTSIIIVVVVVVIIIIIIIIILIPLNYCWSVLTGIYGLIVGRRAVVRRQPRGYISKTKQERPVVTVEHYNEVSTADSVAAIRSSPRRPLGRYSGFKYKICANVIIKRPRVRLGIRPHSCCQLLPSANDCV